MANPNKAKGTRAETEVTNYLREAGLRAFKPRQEGHKDVGDIHVGPFTLQVKNYPRDLLGAIRDAVKGYQVQRVNAGLPFGAGVVKRPRMPISEAYVVIRLEDFPEVVRAVAASLTCSGQESNTERGIE